MAVGLLLCLRSGAVRPVPLQGRWTLPHATFSVALTVCVRFQISVDLFCFAQQYADLASLVQLPKYTGGQMCAPAQHSIAFRIPWRSASECRPASAIDTGRCSAVCVPT